MKNKMVNLNDHLFAQIERLSEEGIKPGVLEVEINRTKAITSVAREIIAGGKLALEARKAVDDREIKDLPPLLAAPVS